MKGVPETERLFLCILTTFNQYLKYSIYSIMIKHFSLAGLLLVISFHLLSQPDLTNFSVSPENEVGLFEKIELRFRLNLYDNNYDSDVIRVDAEFISPSGMTYTVPGFYYVDYIKMPDFNCGLDIACESLKTAPYQPYNWVVRFTPNETGKWTYSVTAEDKRGTSVYPQHAKGSFICHNSEHTGFITKNNNRYLKKGDKPIFLVGTNIAWYERNSYADIPVKETGTNDYKRYIDILAKNQANFMRVWINHPAGISLVGREWTTGEMHSFDNYNQKDAWQLDQIITAADSNSINIVLCLLQQNAFVNSYGVNNWDNNNAFNKRIAGNNDASIRNPFDIFTDPEAIRQTKNLFRYIIARWGYATNIISWELWNEVEQIKKVWQKSDISAPDDFYREVINWHRRMASYIRKTDPYGHLISTSAPSKYEYNGTLFPKIWYPMDLTASHDYQSYKSIFRIKNFETHLLNRAKGYINEPSLTDKPYMSQEWGMTPGKKMSRLDPKGYEYHDCLWSGSMTGAFGAIAIWEWDNYVLKKHLFTQLKPVSVFMNSVVGQLDGSTKGYKTFINGLSVFYATNSTSDIFIGWCQDDNYDFAAVKNTRYIKDLRSDKPVPSSHKNTIQLPVKENKQSYTVTWYDTKTAQKVYEEKVISKKHMIRFNMPAGLRSGTFGDGAFIITSEGEEISVTPVPENKAEEKATDKTIKKGTTTKSIKL